MNEYSCPLCGGVVSRKRWVKTVRLGARTVKSESMTDVCGLCGEAFYAPGEMHAILERAATTLREELGLVSPSEIIALRQRLGLTQRQFEKLLGTSPKTVVRWERGTVCQSQATDTLLRVLIHVPAAVQYLESRTGVRSALAVADADAVPACEILRLPDSAAVHPDNSYSGNWPETAQLRNGQLPFDEASEAIA